MAGTSASAKVTTLATWIRAPGSPQRPPGAPEPMAEGRQHPVGGAGGARQVQRVGDDDAGGGKVSRAVLLELRELLPRPRIEELALAGDVPQRARRLPARRALLPPRQAQPHPVRRLAGQSPLQRRAIAAQPPPEVPRLPEAAAPPPLPRARPGRPAP